MWYLSTWRALTEQVWKYFTIGSSLNADKLVISKGGREFAL